MKDYNLQLRVRNNYLLTMMRARGYSTVAEFCKAHDLQQTTIGKYLNLKQSPFVNRYGKVQLSSMASKLENALGCSVFHLFPPQHLEAPLKENTKEIELDLKQIIALQDNSRNAEQILIDAENEQSLDEEIENAMHILTERERYIISNRFGLNGSKKVLSELAKEFGLSKNRVLQIELSALRKLRKSKALKSAALTY